MILAPIVPFLLQAAAATALSMVVAAIFSETAKVEGQRLDNLNPIGSEYGAPIFRVRGLMRLPGNVIWSRPLREVKTEQEQGGKGGGGGAKVTTYAYFATFAVLMCKGNMKRPVRIWGDKRLLWESPVGESVTAADMPGGGSFEFFPGTDTQGVSAVIQADKGSQTPAYRGRCYMTFSDLPVGVFGNRIPNLEVEIESDDGMDVADFIKEMCIDAGISEDHIDVTSVSAAVHGVQIAPGPANSALEQLMTGLAIQCLYDGVRLSFKPIQTVEFIDVDEGDLLVGDGELFPFTRLREDDLPRTVRLNYIDPARDYQNGTQHRSRQIVSSVQELTLSAPIAMTPTQAIQICDSMLWRMWTARTQYGPFRLPPKYLFLEPGDVLRVLWKGRQHQVRARQITVGANGAIEVTGEAYDAPVYVGVGEGNEGEFPGSELPEFGDTTFRVLDAPAMNDAEASLIGMRFAAAGTGRSWKSAVLERSIDGGATWELVSSTSTYSVLGFTNTLLPSPPARVQANLIDIVSTVEVTLIRGSLSSCTDEQLLAGTNMCMIDGEVLQFGEAVHLTGLRYRLSRLLRGRKGTEHSMNNHTNPEAPFTMLAGTPFFQVPVAQVGVPAQYRATPAGTDVSVVGTFTCNGASAKPWSPSMVRGSRNTPYNDLTVSWVRRSRIGTELPNNGDIPYDEPAEGYILEIYNATWTAVMRSIPVSGPGPYTYTESMQIADFGSVQTSINVRIAHISNLLVTGYATTATL